MLVLLKANIAELKRIKIGGKSMFENIKKFFKRSNKKESLNTNSRDTAKERLHLVLMQDRANVSADFLDLMRQEIIEVIKKYIDIDESALDVRLKNQANEDGTQGAPVLYANIPILNIKDENKVLKKNAEKQDKDEKENNNKEDTKEKEIVEGGTTEPNTDENNNKVDNMNFEKTETNEENKENEQKQETKEETLEENKQEASIDEEIEKEEEEKIEEAKKIVQEENNDTGDSETDK